MHRLKLLAAPLILLILLDAIWLGLLVSQFYQEELGSIAKRMNGELAPNWAAAFVMYVFFLVGLYFFPFKNAQKTNYPIAFGWGFIYGFVVFAVGELSNLAIVQNWPLKVVVIEMLWGGFLAGLLTISMKYLNEVLD